MKITTLRAAVFTALLAASPALWAQSTLGFVSTTASVSESSASVSLQVARSGDLDGAVAVSYSFSGGSPSATSGSDYTAVSGTLNWADDEGGNKTIVVPILNDTTSERTESFRVDLSNPTGGATLTASSQATVSILDNDPALLSITSGTVNVTEGDANASITVQRLGLLSSVVSVGYATTNGTATAGADYTSTSGTLNWISNDGGNKTISVPILNDTTIEGASETFVVNLQNPSNAAIGSTGQSTVTISDNEVVFSMDSSSVSFGEADGTVTISVTRSGDTSRSGSVAFATAGVTATSGADFSATSGTLNFSAGQTAATISLTILEDTIYDESDVFSVTLSNPTISGSGTASLGVVSSTSVTIGDNDGAPFILINQSETATAPAFGSTITLSVTYLGATVVDSDDYVYTWKRGATQIISGGRYSIAESKPTPNTTKVSLTITDVNETDVGSYSFEVANGFGAPDSFTTDVAVTQTEVTRDPSTTSLGIASSSHSPAAILNLPDSRTLVAVRGTLAGANGTSAAFANFGVAVVGLDGRVTSASAGNFNNKISALHRLADGKILVVGTFTSVGSAGVGGIARLNSDFSLDLSFSPSPLPSGFASGEIGCVVTDDQRRIYVGGNFVNYGGLTGYNALVRLLPDGTLDRTFTLGPIAGSDVNVLLRQADGKILVVGDVDSLSGDGLVVRSVYRLNADGTLDIDFTPPLFQADGTGLVFVAAAVDSTGRIYVAKTRGLYRLLPTGAFDPDFVASIVPDGDITQLVVMPDGKLLVGGKFTKVAFDGTSATAARVIRLNVDGTRDASYGVGGLLNTGSSVSLISRAATGRVWIGGDFTSLDSVAANRIMVLEGETPELEFTAQPQGQAANAGASASFTASATGDNGFTFAWFKDGALLADGGRISGSTSATLTISTLTDSDSADYTVKVTSPTATVESDPAPLAVITDPQILVHPVSARADIFGSATLSVVARGGVPLSYQWFRDGQAVIGGTSATLTLNSVDFDDAGGYTVVVSNSYVPETDTSDVAVLTVERRPGAIAANAPVFAVSGGTTPSVNAILRLADNSMLVGGFFTTVTVDGVSYARSNIVHFAANGSINLNFSPNFNNGVRALAQDAAGRIFVGGDFIRADFGSGNKERSRILRMTSLLALDDTFTTTAGGPNGSVYCLAPVGDGSVYAGGAFTAVDGSSSGAYVDLLTSTGARNASFVSGASGLVNALAYSSSGVLFAGGDSNTWTGGVGSGRLVKLSALGARSAFTSPATSVSVKSLLLLSDGTLMVGTNVAPFLSRVSADTGAAESPAYSVAGHLVQIGAILQTGAEQVLSASRGVIKRTDLQGDEDLGFDFSGNGQINALALDSSSRIWVGGRFSTYADSSVSNLIVLAGGDQGQSEGDFSSQTVTFPAITGRVFDPAATTVTLGATASSNLAVTYEVISGPASVSGSTLTITGAGTITVEATQAGNSEFASAAASVTFTVAKANQTISFPTIPKLKTTTPAFELGATTTAAGLSVQYEVSGVATLDEDGVTLTLTGAVGTVTIKASQPGNGNFRAADPVTNTFQVENTALKEQVITFNPLPARTFGTAPAVVNASINVKGRTPVLAVVSGPATIDSVSRKLTLTGAGTVVISASEEGDSDYAPAETKFQTLTVKKATQNILFTLNGNVTLGSEPLVLGATSSSGLAVTYALGAGSTAGTLQNGVITYTEAGKIFVVASQAGDDDYLPARDVKLTITVKTPALVIGDLNTTYDDQPHAVSVTNVPEDFTATVTYQLGTAPATAQPPTNAGKYKVLATLGAQRNTATLTIAKKTLTLTPGDKTVLVGTEIPTGPAALEFFTLNKSGFVGDDDETELDSLPTIKSTGNSRSKQGTYPITLSGGLDNNYAYSNQRGTLTIVGLAGDYEALVVGADSRPLGWLTLRMQNNSFGYTGKLSLVGEANDIALKSGGAIDPLSGGFIEGGFIATGTWSRVASGSLPALQLDMTVSSAGTLTGNLIRGGEQFGTLVFGRLLRASSTGTAGVGAYTMTMGAIEPASGEPEGSGVATVNINASGTASIRGSLADGTKLSISSKVDNVNGYRMFVKPYGNARVGNVLGGYAQLQETLTNSYRVASSTLTWIKPGGNARDRSYRDGFSVDVDANIELWTKPGAKTLAQLLGLVESSGSSGVLGLDFINTSLTAEQLATLPESRTLQPNNTLVVVPNNPSGYVLTINAATLSTGVANGSFKVVVPPSTALQTVPFQAVLRQPLAGDVNSSVVGRGYFLLPGATTAVPATSGEIQILNP